MATFTLQTKNTPSLSNLSENTATLTNLNRSDIANLWASTVLPWQLALIWQFDTPIIDRVFTLQTEH